MAKTVGLVLEGGGMRGSYTLGILDVFLENRLFFPYVIGVSAGACNAASYVSRQIGRGERIAETLTISVSLSQTPPARSSISEARPFSLEWQSCHALSYIVKPRIHTVFRPIEIVALPFPVYRFTLVMKFYH